MWNTPSYTRSMKTVADAQQALQTALNRHDKLMARTKVKCPCKATHKISELTYIQTHWYTRPHGCSGGDYWNRGAGEGICPTCKARLRLTYSEPRLEALKGLFKEVVDEHKD